MSVKLNFKSLTTTSPTEHSAKTLDLRGASPSRSICAPSRALRKLRAWTAAPTSTCRFPQIHSGNNMNLRWSKRTPSCVAPGNDDKCRVSMRYMAMHREDSRDTISVKKRPHRATIRMGKARPSARNPKGETVTIKNKHSDSSACCRSISRTPRFKDHVL
eukprot:6212624-Pleurochrysis_carterae.AAC.5